MQSISVTVTIPKGTWQEPKELFSQQESELQVCSFIFNAVRTLLSNLLVLLCHHLYCLKPGTTMCRNNMLIGSSVWCAFSRSPVRRDRSPVRDERSKKSYRKSRSMTGSPPATKKRSMSASPMGNGRSLSRSPVPRSQSPPPRGVRRDTSRSLSHSPRNGMELENSRKHQTSPPPATAGSLSP